MKFQWYIIDLDEGTVEGTNDVDMLENYIENDQYCILTAQHGKYYLGSRKENEVRELDTSNNDHPDDEPEEDTD